VVVEGLLKEKAVNEMEEELVAERCPDARQAR
jgi:hypothetical protein